VRPDAINADYLVVGAGAAGLAFADQLLKETDATIALVDRRHRVGGHWNDAYPFVRLHQPSYNYGVNSRPLGSGGKDRFGFNAGLDELASGAEVVSYFESVMQQQMLPSGRVQFVPMSEYRPTGEIVSLISGATRPVAAGKVVDATIHSPSIPATRTPTYAVTPGLICAPINDLPKLAKEGRRIVIIGAGKTGMDACLWLLANGASPDTITWIVPRDSWMFNRANFQAGQERLIDVARFIADEVESIAQASSVDDVFERLEARGAVLRLDPAVKPTMHHCATVTVGELAALRSIPNIVRLGRVIAIEADRIALEDGSIPTERETVHIDCTASAIVSAAPRPVFAGNQICLQNLRLCQPVFSAALIAHVEASRKDDAEKNAICVPVPMPSDPVGWLRMMAEELPCRLRWSAIEDIAAFMASSRLDSLAPRMANLRPTDTAELTELDRYSSNVAPAMARLKMLLTQG
jgi:hypothetical protein